MATISRARRRRPCSASIPIPRALAANAVIAHRVGRPRERTCRSRRGRSTSSPPRGCSSTSTIRDSSSPRCTACCAAGGQFRVSHAERLELQRLDDPRDPAPLARRTHAPSLWTRRGRRLSGPLSGQQQRRASTVCSTPPVSSAPAHLQRRPVLHRVQPSAARGVVRHRTSAGGTAPATARRCTSSASPEPDARPRD